MNVLKNISIIIDNFNIKVGKLFSWLLLLMVLLTCLIVILRYLFNIGFIWMQELVRFFYAAVLLICAAYTLAEDAHVRVDIFYSRMGRVTQAWIDLIGSVLMLIPFTVLMFWGSWTPVAISWQIREISPDPGGLPRYPIKSVILICFLLLFLQGLSQVVKKVQFICLKSQEKYLI